jgi:Cu(I)/Ag(I) efflux system membrane protein CusA/SilA
MVGGMISATILTLALIPAIFLLWQKWRLNRPVDIDGAD